MYKDKLQGEYLQTLDKVELYGRVCGIENKLYNELMMNLTDLLITAQDSNKPVDKIIGRDVEAFCKSYFEDAEYTVRDRISEVPKRYIVWVWITFVMEFLDMLFSCMDAEEGFSIWTVTTNISGYLFGFLVAFIIFGILTMAAKPFVFRVKRFSSRLYDWLVFTACVISVGMSIFFVDKWAIQVPTLAVLILYAGYLLMYYGIRACHNYSLYGTWKKTEHIGKPDELYEFSFRDMVRISVDQELPGEFKKRFDKENQRRTKRNKPVMTPEEFTKELHRESVRAKRFYHGFAVGMVLFCIGSSIVSMITESVMDGLILFGILMAVELSLGFVFQRGVTSDNPRERLLRRCSELGMNVIEYADALAAGTLTVSEEEQETPPVSNSLQSDVDYGNLKE
ncbi:MAG: hypothetical protein IJ801_05400 [Lachnospiraceae bacterium]|nr:hypothetical protein [Lachnospiraceae bacterium]